MTISLSQLLPSMFVVAIDVHLGAEATSKLRRLQNAKYLPTVLFASLFPWSLWRGYTGNYPEIEMRKTILGWFEKVRGQVEASLRPFLSGYFANQDAKRRARLPAIEVFTVKGISEETRALEELANDSRWWLDSFGVHIVFNSYRDERLLFVFPDGDAFLGRSVHRLLVIWKPYLESLPIRSNNNDEDTVRHRTSYTLNELLPRLAFVHFIDRVSRNIGRLRKTTFGSMTNRKSLGAYLRLSSTIQRESMLLERTLIELEQQHGHIRKEMEPLSGLKEFLPESHAQREAGDLVSDTFDLIETRAGTLKSQLYYVRESLSNFLVLQNMKAAYALQRYVFWLSIIATIAAIIGAIAAWPIVKQFLQ